MKKYSDQVYAAVEDMYMRRRAVDDNQHDANLIQEALVEAGLNEKEINDLYDQVLEKYSNRPSEARDIPGVISSNWGMAEDSVSYAQTKRPSNF